jgi:linoleoyl-CoA desaturase
VTYLAHRTFAAGIASHYRWLRRMGQPVETVRIPAAKLLPQT